MLVPIGARKFPRANVGDTGWRYLCALEELTRDTSWRPLFSDWLIDSRVPDGFELRKLGGRRVPR